MASLGVISGTVRMDITAALASYAALARANATTVAALRGGAAAMIATSRSFLVMGAAAAAGIGLAINAAAEFEKKIDFFGAVSNSTAEEIEKVSEKALELGQNTRYSASQIADSFIELGKAGVTAQQIIDGIGEAVANLGAAGDIPLAESAQIITSVVQAFALQATDATRVADLLAGAANSSIVDISDLGVSLKYVGGVAHSISVPFEDVIDALSLLGKAGIRGSTAGTSLRQIMVSLTGTSKKAQKTLRELGIITEDGANRFFDAEGKAKPLAEVFQILQDATAGLTEEQRLAAFKIIFNNRALAAANILSRAGAEGFAQMNAEVAKTTAADVAAKRLDNLNGDLLILKSNLETLFIKAGTPFQEFLRGVVQELTRWVQAFAALDPETQKMIFKTIAWTSTILLSLGILLKIIGVILRLVSVLIRLKGVFTLMVRVIKILSWAWRALGLLLLTNPWGWLILAIVAVVVAFVLLWQKSEGFRNFWKQLGKDLVDIGKDVIEWFKGLPKFFTDLWSDIVDIFNAGVQGVKDAWNAVAQFFTDLWNGVTSALSATGTAIADFVTGLPGMVVDGLATAWNAIVDFFDKLPGRIGYAIGFVIGRLIRWGIDLSVWAWDVGLTVTETLYNFFAELPGKIWDALVYVFTNLDNWGIDLFNKSKEIGANVLLAIGGAFADVSTAVYNWLLKAFNHMADWTVEFGKKAGELGKDVFWNIVNFFVELPSNIDDYLKKSFDKVAGWTLAFGLAALNIGKNVWDGLVGFIMKIPGEVWNILGKVVQAFKDMALSAFDKAKEFGKGLWEGFKDGIGINSPSYIEKAMFKMNDNVQAEMKTVAASVKMIQRLGKQVDTMNPALALSTTSAGMFNQAIQNMQGQLAQVELLNRAMAANALGSRIAFGDVTSDNRQALGSNFGSDGAKTVVNMTVYNPTAEPASSTAARKLRTYSAMGVLK